MSIMRRLVSTVAKRRSKQIAYVLNNPIEMMEDKLQTIIERNQDSVLGRDYGFDSIATAEQFAERVPLCDSDSMVLGNYWDTKEDSNNKTRHEGYFNGLYVWMVILHECITRQ
ncbi:MAG: GH3 family domain-containing protein [Candidatus Thorarchaeota archaeon]